MYNFRTDLASERRDIYNKANKLENDIDGIESEKEEINENLKIERVKITNENGEKAIGKPMGNYITIDVKNLKIAQDDEIEKASEVLSNELKKIIDLERLFDSKYHSACLIHKVSETHRKTCFLMQYFLRLKKWSWNY